MVQTTNHEFWVSDTPEDAVRKAKLTLKKLGELTAVVPGQHIVGTVAFGVQKVTLKVAWRAEAVETKMDGMTAAQRTPAKSLGTLLLVESSFEARTGSGGETALRSAAQRFEEAYLHAGHAGYQADRLGLLPVTMIGIVIALLLLGFLAAGHYHLFSPAPMPGASAAAGASPAPDESPAAQ